MNRKEINELIQKIKNQRKVSNEEIDFLHSKLLDTTLGLKLYYKNVEEDYKGVNILNFRDENYLYLKENRDFSVKQNESQNSNLLINSDNFLALHSLKDAGFKADLIYIDPPYNTGNADSSIRYNNDYIDSEDPLRHSKWLSFMKKRLILSRDLLTDKGIIFISIDDKEYAYLKVLMDEVYGEENFLATIVVKSLPNGRIIKNGFARQHEYVICYTKEYTSDAREDLKMGILNENDSKLTNLQRGGTNSLPKDRPNRFYPILEKNNLLFMISLEEYKSLRDANPETLFNEENIQKIVNKYKDEGYNVILPVDSKGVRRVWHRTFDRVRKEIEEGVIVYDAKSGNVKYKPLEIKNPVTWMDDKKFPFSKGAKHLNKIIGKKEDDKPKFGYPKSVGFMKYIINLIRDDNITVLDFFGGSGTTGEAVMELNAEDGGERRFVLVTNNDNDICKEITLPRIYSLLKGADKTKIKSLGIKTISDELHCKYDENFKFLELKPLNKKEGQFEDLFSSEEMYLKEFNAKLDIDLVSKGNK